MSPAHTRAEDGTWIVDSPLIKAMTFEDLQKFDVGKIDPSSRAAKRFPDQAAVDGTKIPLLEDVFSLVSKAKNETVRFNIETKINPLKPEDTASAEQFASALLALIKIHELEKRVSIQSFDWRTLQLAQAQNPNIGTTYLTAQQNWLNDVASLAGKSSLWTAGFNLDDTSGDAAALVKKADGDVWSPFFADLTEDSIRAAQAIGLKVIPWTVNDPKIMAELIDLGVDDIISNFPDQLRKAMELKGLELPLPTPVMP